MSEPRDPSSLSEPNLGGEDKPLLMHLIELRDHLLRSILAVLLIFLALTSFANEIFLIVSEPMRAALPAGSTMVATDVAAPFLTPFKLCFYVALLLTVPYILHQLWSFISPGLYRHEKRLALPLLVSSVTLFYCGVAFTHFVVLPLMFKVLSSAGPVGIAYTPDISRFLDIILKLFLGFGIAFEVPVAAVLLVLSGIATPKSLSKKRPYIIVACFVIGAVLTPPDPLSQSLMAVPMWLLFETGLFVGRFVYTVNPEESNENLGLDIHESL